MLLFSMKTHIFKLNMHCFEIGLQIQMVFINKCTLKVETEFNKLVFIFEVYMNF